jgi:hypothetical protein
MITRRQGGGGASSLPPRYPLKSKWYENRLQESLLVIKMY